MYEQFTNRSSFSFILKAIQHLGLFTDGNEFWVAYGSWVLNAAKQGKSDLDLLWVVHDERVETTRLDGSFDGYPITVYRLSFQSLLKDSLGSFGGYFAGKLLNPYVPLYSTEPENQALLAIAGAFIGPLAASNALAYHRHAGTAEQLLVDSVLARIELCPAYGAYFARYFAADNFDCLWSRMKRHIAYAFTKSGIATQVECDWYLYHCQPLPAERLGAVRSLSNQTFFEWGSRFHPSIPDFEEFYNRKAWESLELRGYTENYERMIDFLSARAL